MGTMGTWKRRAVSAHVLAAGKWVWALASRRGCSRHLGLHCKVEGTTLEGQHGTIVVSCSFRKHPDSHLRERGRHMSVVATL